MPRDYDDDDRPRRRRARDDDDDDRPRYRRQARDDEEDDRPRRRSRREEDDYDDRPRKKKKRPVQKQLNVVGMVGLIVGGMGLLLSFMCFLASWSLIPSILGLIIGFVGLVVAQKSDGRMSSVLPISGMSVSFLAVVIAVGWLFLGDRLEKGFEKEMAEAEAEYAKEEEQRKADLAKAGTEVKAAQPDAILRITAVQFYQAFENNERADRIYRNKIIEVTGVLHEVDFRGDVYTVYLRGGGDEGETVDCHFIKDPALRAQLAQITPGTTVTIRGKCLDGYTELEACILIAPQK